MPQYDYGGEALGHGIAVGFARLAEKKREQDEEKKRDAELFAWAKSIDLEKTNPKVWAEIVNRNIRDIGVAANAKRHDDENTEKRMADLQAKTMAMQDKDIKLASRATVDPTVRGMQQMDFRTGKWSPGARPNPQMVKRMERIGEANPDLYHEEKATVLKGELNPFSERLAAAKNATLALAEKRGQERAKAAGEQEWSKFESGAAPLSGKQLGRMGATFDQRLTYMGMDKPGAQRYAREGEEPEGAKPTWGQADRIREAQRRGLKPGTPEYFDFVHKEDEGEKDKPPVSNAVIASTFSSIHRGLIDDREKQRAAQWGPLMNTSDADLRAMADSLTTQVVQGMQETVQTLGADYGQQADALAEQEKQLDELIAQVRAELEARQKARNADNLR